MKPASKIAAALLADSYAARERLKSSWPYEGSSPEPQAPKCFGDLHRASLQIGPPPNGRPAGHTAESQAAHAAEVAEMREYVHKDLMPRLPDITATTDALLLLPPEMVAKFGRARLTTAIPRAMRACGAVKFRSGHRHRSFWIVRRQDHYAGREINELLALYDAAKVNGPKPDQRRRGAARRARSHGRPKHRGRDRLTGGPLKPGAGCLGK
jgi:hypothetical protein